MPKKIIIFDMDGVIFDSMGIFQKYFIASYPGITEDLYKEIYTGNYHEEIKKYAHLKVGNFESLDGKNIIPYSVAKKEALVFSGMIELLQELFNLGYLLVLNTSAYEGTTLPLLDKAKITTLFDFIATMEVSKSKVEKFNLIAEKYQIAKSDLLFITDSLGDVREAEMSKIPTIAVTWGIHDQSYFLREPHSNLIKIVDSVPELETTILDFDHQKTSS